MLFTLLCMSNFPGSIPDEATETPWIDLLQSYPEFLIQGMWANLDQGYVTITGCETEMTAEGELIPTVWLDLCYSNDGSFISVDTLAASSDSVTVLGASESLEMRRYSTVTRTDETGSGGLAISLFDSDTDELQDEITFLQEGESTWSLHQHDISRTVLNGPEGTCVVFWKAHGIQTVMQPRIECINIPVGGLQAGFHAGPDLDFKQVSLGTFDSIAEFSSITARFGLSLRHIVTGARLGEDMTVYPAAFCLDGEGDPIWRIVLEGVEGGFAEAFGFVYYDGSFQYYLAGSLCDRNPMQTRVFLSVFNENGELLETLQTRPGCCLERIDIVYSLVLLSVVEDTSFNRSGVYYRTIVVFDINDPPEVLSLR